MRVFTRWNEEASTEASNELLTRLARLHLEQICSKAVRDVLPSIDASVHDWCSFDVSALYRLSGEAVGVPTVILKEDIYHASQIRAFFSKRQDIDVGINKAQVAVDTFKETEAQCKLMNEAFRSWSKGGFKFHPDVEGVFHAAQRKIDRVLGPCPDVDELVGYFGPGATTQLPRRMACAKEKLSQPLACSGDMIPVLSSALGSLPHLLEGDSEIVTATVEIHCGKLVTVPKSWKTDRTVMIEPWLNSFFQLGIGRLMAARLKRQGVDVTDQVKNKNLAQIASLTGALATLDLSSASDSISVELVRHLLPTDWYDLLSCLRTSMCEYEGEGFPLEKFSSMGNGFTFALETLIFWALVSSLPGCSSITSVYGDDIIIPTEAVPKALLVLRSAGFSVNMEKSFWTGAFRESCGGDYFSGFDVRPFFIKDKLKCSDVFRLHNQYVARFHLDFAEEVESWISEHVRLYGPQGYGDGHLHLMNPEDHMYRTRKVRRRGWGGYLFDTYTWKKRKFSLPRPGDRTLPLYSIYVSDVEEDGVLNPEKSEREFTAEGIPVDLLPGTAGYKRISIYVLG